MNPYHRLAIYIIWQAIRDKDEEFFQSPWFEQLAEWLGLDVEGARYLALQKIRRRKEREKARRNRPRRNDGNGFHGADGGDAPDKNDSGSS